MPELSNDESDAAAPDTAVTDTAVSDTAVSDTVWPELAVSGSGPSGAVAADPAVLAILDRVRDVPGLPVSEHQAAYTGMHDALLEALNQEPRHGAPQHGQPQHVEPRPGPGAP
jgi:hypothetical protein